MTWSKTASLCQNADDPQPRVVNEPQFESWTRIQKPEPEIYVQSPIYCISERQIYLLSQDVRNRGASVA